MTPLSMFERNTVITLLLHWMCIVLIMLNKFQFQCATAQRHAPELTERLRDVTARAGDSNVILQCRLCGLPLPRVTWYHNASLLKDSTGSSQLFDGDLARLTLTAVSHDHAGEYQCVARNVSGETRTVCQLTVQGMLGYNGICQHRWIWHLRNWFVYGYKKLEMFKYHSIVYLGWRIIICC